MDFKNYLISKAHTDEYDVFMICINHESLFSYIDELKEETLIQNSKGTLLIDQLLVTGNGTNRFVLLEYDHGKIDIDSAENINPQDSYRERAVKLLKENQHMLSNSILSDLEKEYISNEKAF